MAVPRDSRETWEMRARVGDVVVSGNRVGRVARTRVGQGLLLKTKIPWLGWLTRRMMKKVNSRTFQKCWFPDPRPVRVGGTL